MTDRGSGAAKAPTGRRSGYLPSLDGWRALAIFWVILAHDQLRLSPYWHRLLSETGDRGVSLFFALSGLLICGRLLREESEAGFISLKGFYLRRIFRIQPAALTYLAFIALLTLLHLIPAFWKGFLGAVLMIRNLWPGEQGYEYWFTSHFWSLSVEEHFYLLLPAFLVMVRRGRLAILSVLVVLLEVWRLFVFRHPPLTHITWQPFLRTDMAIDVIVLGSIAALAINKPRVQAWAVRWLDPGVALLVTAAIYLRLQVHHSTYDHIPLIATYPLLLVSTILHPRSLVTRLLELPPLRYIGRISFSLYLWQQFFFVPVNPPGPGDWRWHHFLCWAGLFICAVLSYHFIETPLIRIGHRVAMRYTRAPSEAQRPEPPSAL
jgi:peptidoglycan/LPS O-acetylase OafA/YrhL